MCPLACAEFEPYRTSHLSTVQRWVDAGFDADDAQRWLAALAQAMDMSQPNSLGNNVAMDLRIPGTKLVRWAAPPPSALGFSHLRTPC